MAVLVEMGSHFGVGEFTTNFRTYFSGDWDVHWGMTRLLTHGPVAGLGPGGRPHSSCAKKIENVHKPPVACRVSCHLAHIRGYPSSPKIIDFMIMSHVLSTPNTKLALETPLERGHPFTPLPNPGP